MAQYLRQQGTNEVFMVDKDGAHYVNYDYATKNNVFPQVQVVNYRIDQKYPISTPAAQGSTTPTQPIGETPKPFDYKSFGITDQQWNTLSPAEKAFFESSGKILQGQFDQGQTNVSMNAELFNNALKNAQNDPDIQAKYGDALKINQGSLERTLGMINADYGQQMGMLNTQQEEQRKNLALSEAAAGRAQSGFREQAKQRLAQEQSGVIQSSQRQLQQNLNQLGQGLEQTYGTQGLNQFGNIQAGGLSYTPLGGITGSIAGQQKTDIYNQAVQSFNQQQL